MTKRMLAFLKAADLARQEIGADSDAESMALDCAYVCWRALEDEHVVVFVGIH